MNETKRAADDVDTISQHILINRYKSIVAPHVTGCAALEDKTRSQCELCKNLEKCLVCKNRLPQNVSLGGTARGCIICDLHDGTKYKPCPP